MAGLILWLSKIIFGIGDKTTDIADFKRITRIELKYPRQSVNNQCYPCKKAIRIICCKAEDKKSKFYTKNRVLP